MNERLKYFPLNSKFITFYWFFALSIIPFLFSLSLIDEDNLPKLIFITVMMIFLSSVYLIKSSIFYAEKNVLLIIAAITIYFSWSFTRAEIFSSGIYVLFTLLLPFYLFLLIRITRIFKVELIYQFIPASAIILCAYALYQFAVMSTVHFQPVYMIRASMGNKNFLSEALVLYLIFCITGVMNTTGKLKILNLAAVIVILLTILLLQTLSAFMCLGFLILMIPVYLILFSHKKINRKFIPVFLISGIITIALIAGLMAGTPIFKGAKQKIENGVSVLSGKPMSEINNGKPNSIFERLYLWKNSMKLFSESPVTGIGLSDWQIYWPKYGMQGASYLDAAIMRYEHPHNEFVLLITETGILGLIIYSSFYIYFFIKGIRYMFSGNEKKKRSVVFLMLTGLVSMVILSFFGYPLHRPYTMFLLILICANIAEITEENSTSKFFSGKIPVIFILIFSLISLNIFAHRLSGEYYLKKAFMQQADENFVGMLRMLRKSENTYFTTDLSSTPLDWYKGFAMYYSGNDSSMYYYQKSEQQNPYHAQTLSDIGALLENQGKHQEAITYFDKVVSIVPGYYQAHYNLAVAYFNLNKPVEALKEINAKTNVGDQYLNTLDIILARNAEVAAENCGNIFLARPYISDKILLRQINDSAMKYEKGFGDLFCDTVRSRLKN